MESARFFGETVTNVFVGSTDLIDLQGHYAVIQILTDTVFDGLVIGNPIASSGDLNGVTISAGTTLYGVKQYQVVSGTGIAYHSGIK